MAVVATGVAGGVALGMLVLEAPASTRAQTAKQASDAARLPDPVAPAFVVPQPTIRRGSPFESYWAPVVRAVAARAAPGRNFSVIGHLDTVTPEGTSNLVVVLGRGTDRSGNLWVKVRLPVLPNNTVGWVPREALGGYGVVRTRLVIDLDGLRATLFRRGRKVFEADVGVGLPAWPTPRGHFYIRNKLTGFASPTYGPLAFGTSARSAVLTDWPAGGFIGIHGTDRPELVPGRVSHGCIRLRNADILRLGRLMPAGTPLEIR